MSSPRRHAPVVQLQQLGASTAAMQETTADSAPPMNISSQPEINITTPEEERPTLPKRPASDAVPKSNSAHQRPPRPTKHRKSSVSPLNYSKSILAHSRRSTGSCLYPGQNYADLAAWLQLPDQRAQTAYPDRHCLAVLHRLGVQGPGRALFVQCDALDVLATAPEPETAGAGQVLFLRGYPSVDWVTTIGGKYHIDPEFVYRHFGFLSTLAPQIALTRQTLPSASANIIRLRISTILYRSGPKSLWHEQDIRARRRVETDQMDTYRRQVPIRGRCGDSIVRDYITLDHEFSILEQDISLCINECGDGWIAHIWLDVGRDLAQSPPGPWIASAGAAGRKLEPVPIIQHHSKMTVRQTIMERAISSTSDHPMTSYPDSAVIPQTTAILPFDFDTFLEEDIAKHNAFYAVSNLFQHAASSEMQLLNLLEWRIEREMSTLQTDRHESHSLDNLHCFTNVLDRHMRYLRNTLRSIKSSDGTTWPTRSEDKAEVMLKAEKLVEDYEHLLGMALDLSRRCSEGMGIMMNRAVIGESQKAIEQADRLRKLTMLASFFIPLSFTSSLFGMNFRELGQGHLSIWLYAPVAVPVLVLSYLFYVQDIAEVYASFVGWLSGLWMSCRHWAGS